MLHSSTCPAAEHRSSKSSDVFLVMSTIWASETIGALSLDTDYREPTFTRYCPLTVGFQLYKCMHDVAVHQNRILGYADALSEALTAAIILTTSHVQLH